MKSGLDAKPLFLQDRLLKDKGQMSKPYEYTDNIKTNLTCIFLSVRTNFKKTLCPQTLCTIETEMASIVSEAVKKYLKA